MSERDKLLLICRKDTRYPAEAYDFLLSGIAHTQHSLLEKGLLNPEKSQHVSGQQLVLGCCELARREFGLMAAAVFSQWNIQQSVDIGNIVFNMIHEGLMSKTEEDCIADFENVCDIPKTLKDVRIEWEE